MEAKAQTPTLKESTIVERVARIVSSVRGAKPDYTRLAAELEPAIPFDIFGVVLLRHDRLAVRVTVCRREGRSWTAQYHQHPLEGSKLEQLLPTPITIVQNYPDGLDGPPALCGDALNNYHQLRSTLLAPLIVGEKVLGTLELGSNQLDTYTDETLRRLIDAVVHVLAAAIHSAQVGGSAEIQDRQREALKDVSSALTSKVDLSAILDQIVVGIAKALNVSSAIVTYDQRKGHIRLEAQSGLNPIILRTIIANNVTLSEQSIIGYTLRRRQPLFSNDIGSDERFPLNRAFQTKLGIRSIFSYPLVTGTTVYGALILCSPEPGGFTPLKADILSLFASQATIAIHNGMLLESAHQRSRFQQAIEQLEQTYQQANDEQEVLERVRLESQRTFGVSFSSLLHFISEHLLTRSERDLHAIFHPSSSLSQQEDALLPTSSIFPENELQDSSFSMQPDATLPGDLSQPSGKMPQGLQQLSIQVDSVKLLTQTAEAALARAGVLSELSRLFTQLKLSNDHRKDALFVLDLHGRSIFVNLAAEVFCGVHLGSSTESTLEDMFTDVLPRIRKAEEAAAYLQDFSRGNVNRQDLRCALAIEPVFRRKDPGSSTYLSQYGTQQPDVEAFLARLAPPRTTLRPDSSPTDYHYQFSRYPLFNQQGVHIANVLLVHDVTEQVRDEKNKSALLTSVSHDLRTPLTTIKAAVTGLLQEDVEWDDQTRREILEDIDTETEHLSVLVNALVEMSRIEMGALVLDKEWCDVVEILNGALSRLERILSGRIIRTSIPPNLPLAYADHVQLERVFYNLIENALRHSPANAEILVALDIVDEGTADAPLQFLRAKVIDSGIGVSAGERERIFKTFYGLNLRGSGLGLAICRGIIEAHQGHIGVESIPGEAGSCFVFTLPVHAYNILPASPAGEHDNASLGDWASTLLEPPQAVDLHAATRPPSSFAAQFVAPTAEEQL
jgi:signal transduction histidine kinase/GAF domain-containing protein